MVETTTAKSVSLQAQQHVCLPILITILQDTVEMLTRLLLHTRDGSKYLSGPAPQDLVPQGQK